MGDDVLVVPAQDRRFVLVEDERVLEVPAEWRVIEVLDDAARQ
jgi:hypothetical protein